MGEPPSFAPLKAVSVVVSSVKWVFAMRFDLPEYEKAMSGFAQNVALGLLRTHPIFGQMFSHPMIHAGPVRNVAGPEPVDHPLIRAGGELTIHHEVVRQTDIERYVTELLNVPLMMASQLQRQFFTNVEEITQATGNVRDVGGEPFSFDHFIEIIRMIDLDFDDEGSPILSDISLIGDFGNAICLPDPTEDQIRTFEAVIAAKKAEFDAKKRVRRLSEPIAGA